MKKNKFPIDDKSLSLFEQDIALEPSLNIVTVESEKAISHHIFSVIYIPTALFSLKDSNSTNSGAKSLFLPSPYSIKMAILNQAITIGGELDDLNNKYSSLFKAIREAKISFYLQKSSSFCVNNTFIKILKPARDAPGFQETVSFREYIHLNSPLEIIFEVADERAASYLKKYLHNINYFGKRSCFFQFLSYNDNPHEPNVVLFNPNSIKAGILQKYDDFDEKVTFEMVNNFSSKATKRKERFYFVPLNLVKSSKSFWHYKVIENL